jgi:hypothetical protein
MIEFLELLRVIDTPILHTFDLYPYLTHTQPCLCKNPTHTQPRLRKAHTHTHTQPIPICQSTHNVIRPSVLSQYDAVR